ncbi:MAG: metalloregulator ArsR/SmtB family transcription factor [Bacteroidota bacterium]|nr:transcriptional regulator [Odoribacter sp.]MDP3641811.1 metalloregulator ArsR/SmtB family transcription factor [Bacteroidota bacterium]
MVVSKTELFNKELQERANLFKALAHPARLQILQFLAQTKTCITGDISERFPLTRATVNQHMKELRDAGLICGHTEGSKIVYCLDIENVKAMEKILIGLRNEMHLPADFCCALETLPNN